MRTNDQKRTVNYGAFCGLRPEDDSDSSRASTPDPEQTQQVVASTIAQQDDRHFQRRPVSLTLPFENRERESHLVSDEELDRIIRQGELEIAMPALPTAMRRESAGVDLRRSISTRRNTTFFRTSAKARPMSADWGSMMVTGPKATQGAMPVMPKDPTLTALPRPPTKNELARYPDEGSAEHPRSKRAVKSSTKFSDIITTNNRLSTSEPNRHKRHFSTADIVESVKKRLKRIDSSNGDHSPSLAAQVDVSSPSRLSIGSPVPVAQTRKHGLSNVARPENVEMGDRESTMADLKARNFHVRAKGPSDDLKKSLLKRTWSKTRHHAAKLSISSPAATTYTPKNSNRSKLEVSDPFSANGTPAPSLQARPETSMSQHTVAPSMLSGTSITSSGYEASAEPSPITIHSLHMNDPNSVEYISGPTPKKSLLTKLGAPPGKKELNTIVTRQQSRITDLSVQNRSLVGQIERLRDEVQGLKVDSSSSSQKENDNYRYAAGSGNEASSERTLNSSRYKARRGHEYEILADPQATPPSMPLPGTGLGVSGSARRESGGTVRVMQDPQGWRHIMGVPMSDGGDGMEMDKDEKRKTWMTCDS